MRLLSTALRWRRTGGEAMEAGMCAKELLMLLPPLCIPLNTL